MSHFFLTIIFLFLAQIYYITLLVALIQYVAEWLFYYLYLKKRFFLRSKPLTIHFQETD